MKDKRPGKYVLVYAATLGWDLLTWLGMIIMWVLWGTLLRWAGGVWFEFKKDSWPARTWYAKKKNGKPVEIHPDFQHKFGKYYTWGGTSFGHAGFLGPGRSGGYGIDTDVEFHEHDVHGEQAEVASVYALIINVIFILSQLKLANHIDWLLHIAIWVLAWPASYACSMVVANLRGENFYRGNIYEESAYSQTKDFHVEEKP